MQDVTTAAPDATPDTANDPARPYIPRHIANLVADARAHADGRLVDTLEWLRAHQPLGIAEPDGFAPFWVVTRQADLRAIAMKPDLFHNGDRNVTLHDKATEAKMVELLAGRAFPVRTILSMDPPDHPKYRAVAADFFHARNLDTLAERISGIARRFVDRLEGFGGEVDFAQEIAFLYPLHVIMDILGVPESDEMRMLKLTQEFFGHADEELSRDGGVSEGEAAGQALFDVTNDFFACFEELLAEKRQNPQADLLSVLARATIDGAPMPRLELLSYCVVAATAGHDTTAAVTARGMQALCEDPTLLDRLRGDDEAIKAFVEEAARLGTPSKLTMRSATQDVVLCDRQFRKGDWVAMCWSSGNQDEALFDNPRAFSIDRKPNKLISYGNGPHVCLGQHLARLEMRQLFKEIAERVEAVELAGDTRCMVSLMVSGLTRLPIRFRMRA